MASPQHPARKGPGIQLPTLLTRWRGVFAEHINWWFWAGWLTVAAAVAITYVWPAASDHLVAKVCLTPTPTCAKGAVKPGTGVFQLGSGFASLAGFTFLAAALERLAEFTLAPWWGKVRRASKPALDAKAKALGVPRLIGVGDAAALQERALKPEVVPAAAAEGARYAPGPGGARAGSAAEFERPRAVAAPAAAPAAAAHAAPAADHAAAAAHHHPATHPPDPAVKAAADSVYVAATKQRPTIMLPMAAAAIVICAGLRLYLLHSLAKSGLPDGRLAFTVDAFLTGFALAGGAQPFHDLVSSLTAKAS